MSRQCLRHLQKSVYITLFQAVLNQKFTDCFVLVFLDAQAGKTVSYSSDLKDYMLIHVCKRPFSILLPPAELKGCVSGAAAITDPGQQQPPSSTGVHVPSPGVSHQHSLLQPLDRAVIERSIAGLTSAHYDVSTGDAKECRRERRKWFLRGGVLLKSFLTAAT